ncbi:toll-like receptor 2 [Megalops cyprinoides]|uniref:toll-like receptor 2 n=1 Tax=Megalops cyprinoides TaxID=118141 RepID=UPI0018644464|nr:toll-like receptor 2 [Megalops cyprinoides]
MKVLVLPLSSLFFLCLLPSHSAEWERKKCTQCDKHLFCDCSDQNLVQVPSIPENVQGLNLSHNQIEVLKEDDLQEYAQLKTLYLQNNRIRTIHNRTFASLANLESLDLSYNFLASLSWPWFDQLLSLKRLNLLGNLYTSLGSGFLFRQLSRLRSLRLGNRSFRSMGRSDLVGLRGLDEMVLHGSGLQSYEDGSLGSVGPIGTVTLSLYGPFHSYPALASKILRDVSNPETLLILTDVTLADERSTQPIVELKQKAVRRVIFRNVSVTDSGIVNVMRIMDRSEVSFLGVEDSQLVGHGFWTNASATHPDKMETLYIKNVAIRDFYAFSSLAFLQNVLQFPKSVSIINSNVFLMPCPTSKLLKKLEYLDFSGNLLTDLATKESFCNGEGTLQHLRSLNLSRNSLSSLALMSTLFTNLNQLTSLDLSENDFSDMPAQCAWPSSLQYLNLSTTKLRRITPCVPPSLHILDLNDNDLTEFNLNLPNLIELRISGNKFKKLPPGIFLPSLEVLLVQRNMLSMFGKSDLMDYKKLQELEAGHNKFVCSCGFVAFFQLEVGQLVRLRDGPESYQCDSPTALRGQQVGDTHLSAFECHMVVAVSVLCTLVFLFFFISGVLCYKLHAIWYLKMTWAWLKAKRKRSVNRDDIRYDAFVSYSERDSEWVEEFLVQELENAQPPFRLCLHKRDFLPGGWIADNIMNAMEKSRRTLFVLSRHFVGSEWCRYELEFSHFRLFDENNDTAVLILLEPIAKETIPKRFCKLRKFMNSRTYLEWPEDETQRPMFWHNLKMAIKADEC